LQMLLQVRGHAVVIDQSVVNVEKKHCTRIIVSASHTIPREHSGNGTALS